MDGSLTRDSVRKACHNPSFRALGFILILGLLATGSTVRGDELAVTFRVNDAFVKDNMVDQVQISIHRVEDAEGLEPIALGTTDSEGLLRVDLHPGEYRASFSRQRYVPLATSFLLERDGQIITTTLSMMLEAEGVADSRRIRVILNWGSDESSQIRDVDAHLLGGCGEESHVNFADREHLGQGHGVDLDVDDMDWGGPETITLQDPPPGRYVYWLHDYSEGPGNLGSSDVVVRVLFGDSVAGEFRAPRDLVSQEWRPFEAIEVGQDLEAEIVPFAAEAELGGSSRRAPEGYEDEGSAIGCFLAVALLGVSVLLVVIVIVIVARGILA